MSNDGTLKEEAGGLGDRIAGNVKDAAGAITGNERLEREGEAQADFGAARQANNDVLGSNTSTTTSTTRTSTGDNRILTGMFNDRESAESL